MDAVRRARDLVLAVLLACVCVFPPAAAEATQSVKLGATLTPEHLGQGTTIGFSFQIEAPAGLYSAAIDGDQPALPGEPRSRHQRPGPCHLQRRENRSLWTQPLPRGLGDGNRQRDCGVPGRPGYRPRERTRVDLPRARRERTARAAALHHRREPRRRPDRATQHAASRRRAIRRERADRRAARAQLPRRSRCHRRAADRYARTAGDHLLRTRARPHDRLPPPRGCCCPTAVPAAGFRSRPSSASWTAARRARGRWCPVPAT